MDGYQRISDCIKDLQAIMAEKGDLPVCLCVVEKNRTCLEFEYQFDWLETETAVEGDLTVCAFVKLEDFDGLKPTLKVIK